MNKFKETDFLNGKYYIYCGIMNAIADIEIGNCREFDFGDSVTYALLTKALEERGWECGDQFEIDDKYKLDIWDLWFSPNNEAYSVNGNLLSGGLKLTFLYDAAD